MAILKLFFTLVALPAAFPGALFAAVISVMSWSRVHASQGVLWVHLSPWAAKRWSYSTTLGYVILLHPQAGPGTLKHELVHVEQFEIVALFGALTAALCWSWLGLCAWVFSWPMFYACAAVRAWVGGGEAYHDNILERQAYREGGS